MDDRLNREERIRLEALNQANRNLPNEIGGVPTEKILNRAKKFEKYILGEDD